MKFLGLTISQPLEAVVVSLKSGDAIKGVLVDRSRDGLVLRAAFIASVEPTRGGGVTWKKMDGDVVIPIENLSYYQTGLPAADLVDVIGGA